MDAGSAAVMDPREDPAFVPGHPGNWPIPARDRRLGWLMDRGIVYYPILSGAVTTAYLFALQWLGGGGSVHFHPIQFGFVFGLGITALGLATHFLFWGLKWLGASRGECPPPGSLFSRQLTPGCALTMGTTVTGLFAGLATVTLSLLAALLFTVSNGLGGFQTACSLFFLYKTLRLVRFRVRVREEGVEVSSGLSSTELILWDDLVLMERPSRPVVMDEWGKPRTWLILYSSSSGACYRLPITFKGRETLREEVVSRLARQGRYLSPFPDQVSRPA